MRSVVSQLKKHCAIQSCVPLLWSITEHEEKSRDEARASSGHLKGSMPSLNHYTSSSLLLLPSEEGSSHHQVQNYKNTSHMTRHKA